MQHIAEAATPAATASGEDPAQIKEFLHLLLPTSASAAARVESAMQPAGEPAVAQQTAARPNAVQRPLLSPAPSARFSDADSLEVGGGMHTPPRSGSPSRLPPALRRPSSPAVQRLAPPPLPPSPPGSAFLGVARHVALARGLGSDDNANPSPKMVGRAQPSQPNFGAGAESWSSLRGGRRAVGARGGAVDAAGGGGVRRERGVRRSGS